MVRYKLKLLAKGLILAPRRPHLVFVTLLYIIISASLLMIVVHLSEIGRFQMEILQQMNTAAIEALRYGTALQIPIPELQVTAVGMFFFVVPFLFMWMIDLGYLYYARGVTRGEEGLGYRSLFEGFNYFLKGILLRLLSYLIFFVGFALFVVPGIIAMMAFSQADLLLLDHPDKSVFWHLKESARIMQGHKWEYLVLRLSFIGWVLLVQVPFLHYAVRVWYTPYSTLTFVNYYHSLTGQGPKVPKDGWQKPGMF